MEVRKRTMAESSSQSSATALIGRDTEITRLAELVRAVAAGQGQVVLVEGEPGIGKTALLRAGLADAAALGCREIGRAHV